MSDIRDRIIQLGTKPVLVKTEELGDVHIRRLTLGELDEMRKENEPGGAPKVDGAEIPVSIRLLARFIGDERGQRVFDQTKPADVAALREFAVSAAAEILRAGNRLNRMAADDAAGKG